MQLRLPLSLFLVAVTAGCHVGTVPRVFDGVLVEGRFINDWAYASYARGIEWEARGEPAEALAFFEQAAEQDPESVEVWTRIAGLRCKLDASDGDAAFDEALRHDASYAPLWRARSECARKRKQQEEAIEFATRAVALDPSSDETVIGLARLLAEAGQHDEAERWLRSLVARSPTSMAAWQAVAELARPEARGWLAHARLALADGPRTLDAPSPAPTPRTWSAVDRALVSGSLAEARTSTRRAHLDMRLLAARAILVGRPELALEEATLRVAADPSDSDARIAYAAALDRLGRGAELDAALADIPAGATRMSRAAQLLFAELLQRHAGVDAAALWLGVSPSALEGDNTPSARLAQAFEEAGS